MRNAKVRKRDLWFGPDEQFDDERIERRHERKRERERDQGLRKRRREHNELEDSS